MRARQLDLGGVNGGGVDSVIQSIGKSGVPVGYIVPATTFTAATPSSAAGGAETLLTSAGAHGLTGAVAVGKHLYIASGTGWTTGFYEITAIAVDTTGTTIQIDVPYDAGMGAPVIALAGVGVAFVTLTIPPLQADSYIKIDGTWSFAGSTNAKNVRATLDNQVFYGAGTTNATHINMRPSSIIIQNRGVTNSQVVSLNSGSVSQNSVGTLPPTTLAVGTSVSTSLTLGGFLTTANEFIYLERYIVQVYL